MDVKVEECIAPTFQDGLPIQAVTYVDEDSALDMFEATRDAQPLTDAPLGLEAPSKDYIEEVLQRRAAIETNDVSSMPFPVHGTTSSVVSLRTISWVSAPAVIAHVHCFLPRTIFRRRLADGLTLIRAAELSTNGNIELQGPDDTWVAVQHVRRHPPQERDFVRVQVGAHSFISTAEHRLCSEDNLGQRQFVEAGRLVAGNMILGGDGLASVTATDAFTATAQVIEVSFDDDVAVLAWTLPQHGRNKPASMSESGAVAVMGCRHEAGDLHLGWSIQHTFLEPQSTQQNSPRRSRSTGAAPSPRSSWSIGSCWSHCARPCPGVCLLHERMRRSQGLPCPFGAFCTKCHACHAKFAHRRRLRSGRAPV